MRILSLQSFRAVAFVLGCLVATTAQANRYLIVDLGKHIYPSQINESGEVSANVQRSTGSGPSVIRDGRLHHLCCSHSYYLSYAAAINDRGDVVGQDGNENDAGPPIMWRRGGIRLVLPMPNDGPILAVNGVARDGTTVGLGGGGCFRTSPTGPATLLGYMGHGSYCEAFAINQVGQIAGWANATHTGPFHAFIWTDGTFQDLGAWPGTSFSVGIALNDHGDVVGYSDRQPILWSHGQMYDLDPGNVNSFDTPLSINNSGVIVGYVNAGAVRFDPSSGPTLLINEVVNVGDWLELTEATSVNDAGVIVGWGVLAGETPGRTHGYMLVPKPEQ